MVTGRDPVLPMDTLLGPKIKYVGDEYVPTMLQRLHRAYTPMKAHMQEARDRNKHYVKQKAQNQELKPGDAVYYHDITVKPGDSAKFHAPWKPFYRIIEVLSPVTFKIVHQPTGRTKVVHSEKLRLAHPESAWDQYRDKVLPVCSKARTLGGNTHSPTWGQRCNASWD